MYMMNQVYHIVSVPTWNTVITSWSFYLTIVLGGLVLAYTLLISNKQRSYQLNFVPGLFTLAVLCVVVVCISRL